MTPPIIGIDLAWGERNASGAAVLVEEHGVLRTVLSALLGGDDEILAFVERHRGLGATVVAIDAPLIAPNPKGTGRPVDREVSRRFGRFDAGAYPANEHVCARPIRLAAKLVVRGFTLDPAGVAAGRPTALEVYPHAATIGLFDLLKTIKYKKGCVAEKRAGLTTLQNLIHARLPTHPAVRIDPPPKEDPGALKGRALKGLEDRLDAVVCATVGAHFRADPKNWRVIGDTASGYIVVPVV